MNEQTISRYLNKVVFIQTESGRNYSGILKEVHNSGNKLIWVSILDKFNKWVTFEIKEIKLIEEDWRDGRLN